MHRLANFLLIFLILTNIIYAFSGVRRFNLSSMDAYSIWLFKTKAFHLQGKVPDQIITNPQYRYNHTQYPILLPLVLSPLFNLNGTHTPILYLYPFLYTAILLTTYLTLRLIPSTRGADAKQSGVCNPTKQLISQNPKPSTPSHKPSTISYLLPTPLLLTFLYSHLLPLLEQAGRFHAGTADIWITLFYSLATYFIVRHHTAKNPPRDRVAPAADPGVDSSNIFKAKSSSLSSTKRSPTWLSAWRSSKPKNRSYSAELTLAWTLTALTIITSQIKTEGLFLASTILFIPQLPFIHKILPLTASSSGYFLWKLYKQAHNYPPGMSYQIHPPLKLAKDALTSLKLFALELLNLKRWSFLWPLSYLSHLAKTTTLTTHLIYTLTFNLFLFLTIYVTNTQDPATHITSSFSRLLLQLSPLTLPTIATQLTTRT